jgi:putative DNA primase/helicase
VITLARADRRLAATSDQWDADPWLLNTPAGAVNLRTGDIRPHRREDYCTKITAVGPHGDCPTFKAFLLTVMSNDQARVAFLRRACGYCLTGDTSEQAIFFNCGVGQNGKSVLMETLAGILADYCVATPIETFTESRNDRHPSELASLRGARLVTATETEASRYWAESRLKELTGGERIAARFMHKDQFEYAPQFKPWISGNHRPRLRSVGKAMRRRVRMVPFNVTIADDERDREFAAKLKPEWPGILQLMINGCLEWQKSGLAPPAAVEKATDAYFAAEDGYADWIADRCETSGGFAERSTKLFGSWRDWADKAGQRAGDNKQFREEMERLGYPLKHTMKGNIFIGLRIRQDPPEPDDPGRSATAAPELDLEQPDSPANAMKADEARIINHRITRAHDARVIRQFKNLPSSAFIAPETPPGGPCAQCGKPSDGREEFCALPDEEVWLHPECQRAYVNRGAPRGERAYTVLGAVRASERCSLCGDGKPRPMRIRRGGEVNIWHEACADRYVATIAVSPPAPEQDGSGPRNGSDADG